jgi:hypothetical protein
MAPFPSMKWWTRLGHFALDYLDLLLAAILALLFSLLGAFNQLKGDGLTQAAIALLGVLSLVVFRERWERGKAVASINRAVESMGAPRQWQVLDETLTWNIRSRNSAESISERDLRFLGAEVFTIQEFERGTSGSVTQRRCEGAAPGHPLQPLRVLEPGMLGPEGRMYYVVCLESVWRRGDRMRLRYERQLTNSFLADRENVGKQVQVETDRLVMRVAWPRKEPPTEIRLERTGGHSELLHPEMLDGRATVQQTIDSPRLGEVINISWTW